MSINSVMSTGLSALLANQSALRTTSNNIANVNTEGYVRQDARTSQIVMDGKGAGVELIVQRAADRFLQATHTASISKAGQYDAAAGLLDRAQAAFGDPSGDTSIFSGLDRLTEKASSLINDPTSALRRSDLIASVENTFQDIKGAYAAIDGLRDEANQKLSATVSSANMLMEQVANLNAEIQKQKLSGSDASAAETQQSRIMDQLAGMIDFKVSYRELGGVELRTTSGLLLVDHRAAELKMGEPMNGSRFGGISITPPGSNADVDITRQIQGGELRGLMNTRDSDLPEISYALGEFSSALASALNQAHNEGTSVPAPASLTGRNTGLQAGDSLGFTGSSIFAVIDSNGRTIESVTVDFDAGTLTTSAGAVSATGGTIGSFAGALNASFGASANVSFTNGTLSVSAAGGNGIAVAQDETNPSARAGRGVSAFFGLNDLVTSNTPAFFGTGLTGTDAHGFSSGEITFGVRNGNGDLLQTIAYTPTGATLNDVVNELNSSSVLGNFATAGLDADGRLNIKPNVSGSVSAIDVVSDSTQRGTTGLSMSSMFGLGIEGPSERARSLGVKEEIAIDSSRLATSRFNPASTAVGSLGVATGDNSGALALQSAMSKSVDLRTFQGTVNRNVTLTDAAAQLAADAGTKATYLENRAEASLAIRDEAATRRASAEGVNLDEEMVKMTIYQQSYSAASRLIQASKDMYDTLLNMV